MKFIFVVLNIHFIETLRSLLLVNLPHAAFYSSTRTSIGTIFAVTVEVSLHLIAVDESKKVGMQILTYVLDDWTS